MPEDNVKDTNKINEALEAFDQADPNLEFTISETSFLHLTSRNQFIHPTQNMIAK